MEQLTVELTPAMLALVPIVGVILQALKRVKVAQQFTDWFPFVGMLVAYGLIYVTTAEVQNAPMAAILIGLASSKGYDLVKGNTKKT